MVNYEVMKENIVKILNFIKNPVYKNNNESKSISANINEIISGLSLAYAIIFPVGIIINIVLSVLKYNGVNSVDEFINSNSLLEVILLGAIIAPIVEESIFRLSLRVSAINCAISAFALLYFIANILLKKLNIIESYSFIIWLVPLVVSASLAIVIDWRQIVKRKIENFVSNKFKWVVYISSACFGLVHILNYSDISKLSFAVLIVIIPQIVVGCVLAYLRVNNGFVWGVLFHIVYNLSLILPTALIRMDSKIAQTTGSLLFILVFYCGIAGIVNLIKIKLQKKSAYK